MPLAIWMAVLLALPYSRLKAAEGVDIPTGHGLPLEIALPVTRDHTVPLVLWERDGKCHFQIGSQQALDAQVPPPCDIMTKGRSQGFKPWVGYNTRNNTPEVVRFRIVGALKYFPGRRSECGTAWRDVELRPAEIAHGRAARVDIVVLPPAPDDGLGIARCTRSHMEVKGEGPPY